MELGQRTFEILRDYLPASIGDVEWDRLYGKEKAAYVSLEEYLLQVKAEAWDEGANASEDAWKSERLRALFLTLCEPMAAHDAEVARAAKAEALEEAASSPIPREVLTNGTRAWLRARAAEYRKGKNNEQ